MNKHKWYNEIVAWAEGKPIQYRYTITPVVWRDFDIKSSPSLFDPNDAVEFRVKPNIIKYRIYIGLGDVRVAWCNNDENTDLKSSAVERCSSFAKWLTDWIEIES